MNLTRIIELVRRVLTWLQAQQHKPGEQFRALPRDSYRLAFSCKCGCGFDDINKDLVGVLHSVEKYYGKTATVTSGCRCRTYNDSIPGSARSSQHILGNAVDFIVHGVAPKDVADYLVMLAGDKWGIGRYSGFTHLDVRRNKARWGVN